MTAPIKLDRQEVPVDALREGTTMNVTVSKKDLLRLVARLQGVVEKRSTMPILSNVLLTARTPVELHLAATDLYLSLAGTIPMIEMKRPGTVALPAKDLFERIRMMPDGPVTIEADEEGATKLRAPGVVRRYTMRGLPGSDFPPMPSPSSEASRISIAISDLRILLATTYYAISSDETRPHMNSALFEWDGPTLRMVATDGHRLAKKELRADDGAQASVSMLLSQKTINELRRMCDELSPVSSPDAPPAKILISVSGPTVFFQEGPVVVGAKLIDAQFPPYNAVIPTAPGQRVVVPRAAFIDALRAVALVANASTGGIRLSIAKNVLEVSSAVTESGDGTDEIHVDYSGNPIALGLNAKYMLDVLGCLEEEDVALGINGELDPLVIQSAKDPSFIAVVMPMRL